MAGSTPSRVAICLPAELVAKMEDLKQDREEDRGKSVEEIVQHLCQSYVRVSEMRRWEANHMDDINKSYEEHPNDWEDADVWEAEYRRAQEEQP